MTFSGVLGGRRLRGFKRFLETFLKDFQGRFKDVSALKLQPIQIFSSKITDTKTYHHIEATVTDQKLVV